MAYPYVDIMLKYLRLTLVCENESMSKGDQSLSMETHERSEGAKNMKSPI